MASYYRLDRCFDADLRLFREEIGAVWKGSANNNVCMGWIWTRDGITVSEWEIVRMPQLPIYLADNILLSDNYVRMLKATFGMYPVHPDPAELPAFLKYEKHVTAEAASQTSTPRFKFTTYASSLCSTADRWHLSPGFLYPQL